MVREVFPNNVTLPNGHTLNNLIDNKTRECFIEATPTRISHEVPLSMLEMSRGFNDYDYALVHLFKDYPQYFDFYKKSVEMGRMVILDNSLYELGEAFNMKEYAEWIEKLNPTHYIIPDTFWSSQATIEQAMEWMTNYGRHLNPGIKKIGVAQGITYKDIKRTYQFMDSIGCDCIAFTFKFSPEILRSGELNLPEVFESTFVRTCGYELSGEDLLSEDKDAITRYMVLRQLDLDGVINKDKEHHLLGLQNTTALRLCCSFPWVTSIDTSNPIINGVISNLYHFNNEVLFNESSIRWDSSYIGNSGHPKTSKTLADIFDLEPPQWMLSDIMHNVRCFREIVNPSIISTILLTEHRMMNESYVPECVRNIIKKEANNG